MKRNQGRKFGELTKIQAMDKNQESFQAKIQVSFHRITLRTSLYAMYIYLYLGNFSNTLHRAPRNLNALTYMIEIRIQSKDPSSGYSSKLYAIRTLLRAIYLENFSKKKKEKKRRKKSNPRNPNALTNG